MAKLEILTAPDPFLKTTAQPVAAVTDDIRRLIDDMLETMYAADGIGLAAIQVGRSERVIVVDVSRKDQPNAPMALVNPEILWTSEDLAVYEEGCLSVPENYADVSRPARARIRYLDRDGTPHEEEMEGLLATCVQHEIDHLDGVLFIDHISRLKRDMILRRLKRMKRAA